MVLLFSDDVATAYSDKDSVTLVVTNEASKSPAGLADDIAFADESSARPYEQSQTRLIQERKTQIQVAPVLKAYLLFTQMVETQMLMIKLQMQLLI